MNRILNLHEKQVAVFGIGTNAKILREIYAKSNIGIVAWIVSDDQEISMDEYAGLPVYKISECSEKVKRYPVVISVRESVLLKVKRELVESGFENIVSVDDYKEWVEILEYFYRSYFMRKSICIEDSVISINGSRFINGFQLDMEGKYSFLVELGDIILPSYFDDYSICNEGPYELAEIDFKVDKGDVVFDCGANMGLFSALALNRGGVVYGFEPTPHTRKYLQRYMEIYPVRFHMEPYALSDAEGETSFYIGSNMNGENSIRNLSGTAKECITVPMTTIDQFVMENHITKVDFIKADIEGAERYMLAGAKKTLRKFSPKLAICTYHLRDDPKVLEDIIRQANPYYKIVHKYKKLYAFIEK